MDLNQTTQKVQEAMQAAQSLALRYGHQEVDGEHLLAALLDQADGLAPRLLERLGVAVPALKARIEPLCAITPENLAESDLRDIGSDKLFSMAELGLA